MIFGKFYENIKIWIEMWLYKKLLNNLPSISNIIFDYYGKNIYSRNVFTIEIFPWSTDCLNFISTSTNCLLVDTNKAHMTKHYWFSAIINRIIHQCINLIRKLYKSCTIPFISRPNLIFGQVSQTLCLNLS